MNTGDIIERLIRKLAPNLTELQFDGIYADVMRDVDLSELEREDDTYAAFRDGHRDGYDERYADAMKVRAAKQ